MSSLTIASIVFCSLAVTPNVYSQAQDLPATATANLEVIPVGSYVIPMDNVRQGNAGGTTFNKRAYGLAVRLLHAGVPLKWAIKKGKLKDGVDFTADATKIRGTGGGSASGTQPFSGGPLIVHPGYEAAALTVIDAFNGPADASDVVVYRTITQPAVVDVRYTLTHKPFVGVGAVNSSIHMSIFASAGMTLNTHYREYVDTDIQPGTCLTLVTQPHTESPAAINLIKSFVQNGGNYFAQCRAVNTYENQSPFGQYQTNLGYNIDNLNGLLDYPNADMPMNQFVGILNGGVGGSERDWELNPGSVFINNTFITLQNQGANNDHYAGTVSKQYNTGPGGMTFYLGGHEYGDSGISNINGERTLLNAVLQPPTRPTACGIDLGFPLVKGFKSVRLGTENGDDVTNNNAINVGDTIEWKIDFVNSGSFKALNFQITDSLPANTSFVSGSLNVTNNGVDGTTATANGSYNGVGVQTMLAVAPPAVLGVNGVITVTFKTKILPHFPLQVIHNQATASGIGFPDTNTDNIDSNPQTSVPPSVIIPPNSELQDEDLLSIDPTTVLLIAPTAAAVTAEGRVIGTNGRGLSGIGLEMVDAFTSEVFIARTNSFGYFKFEGLEIGRLYVMSAESKRYTFPAGSISITLSENVSGITLVGVDRQAVPAPPVKAEESSKKTVTMRVIKTSKASKKAVK